MAVSTSRDTILIERRYAAVLDSLSDQSLATLTMAVSEKLRDPLAKVLALFPAEGPVSRSRMVASASCAACAGAARLSSRMLPMRSWKKHGRTLPSARMPQASGGRSAASACGAGSIGSAGAAWTFTPPR